MTEQTKYAVMFGWLVLETGKHTCDFGDYGVHESHCGYEPLVKISEIEKFFSVGIEERYEGALYQLLGDMDYGLFEDLRKDPNTGKNHFPEMAKEFKKLVDTADD